VPQVEVTFDIDANGIVNVSAKDRGTGKEQKITITASSGLDDKEIERMVEDASSHAEEDKKRRQTVEARNRLDSLVYSVDKTLGENKEKLSADEIGAVNAALEEAKKALESDDPAVLEAASDGLEKSTHKLAEAMYRGAEAGGPEAGAAAGDGGAEEAGDVIDAEVVDADGKSNN
jgi:molecular chaperone DnaK